MPKQYLLALVCAVLLINTHAQTPDCGFSWACQQLQNQPELLNHQQGLEHDAFQHFKNSGQTSNVAPELLINATIPVVVHIIHNNGPENISDAQVHSAIDWLNQCFSNEGIYDQGTGAHTMIQFCLASRTPEGQATNGITRNTSTLTDLGIETQDIALKNLNRWTPKHYLNIWVVGNICSSVNGCGISAYAFPPAYHGLNADGIVIEAAWFGANPEYASLLAHETGHYFGLLHTFEGGCTNNDCLLDGDRVCDTPPDQSTAGVPCGQAVNTCNTDAQSGFSTDQPDMTSNFLDYNILNCEHDFTTGQAARMQFFLTGKRKSLLDSKGCLPPCPAFTVAAFAPSDTVIFAGQTISFDNNSQNYASLSWEINNIVFSNQTNPSYTFNTLGLYTVTLILQPLDTLLCAQDTAAFLVQVNCPAIASFLVSNTGPLVNMPVLVTNNSQNALQSTWLLNGQPLNEAPDTLVFPVPGTYSLQLTVYNNGCSSSQTTFIVVSDSCSGTNFIQHIEIDSMHLIAKKVVVLADGNLLVAYADSYMGFNSVLQKIASDGSNIWVKQLNAYENISAICAMPDGGVGIAAYSYSYDICYVHRLNNDGEILWSAQFDTHGNSNLIERINGITPTSDGGLAVCGTYRPNNTGNLGAFFAKFNANSTIAWANIRRSSLFSASDIIRHPEGGFVAAGHYRRPGASNGFDGVLYRLDENGAMRWIKSFSIPSENSSFFKILPGKDGTFLLAGTKGETYYPDGLPLGDEIWVVDVDQNGDFLWSKSYRSTQITADFTCTAGAASASGGYLLGGMTRYPNIRPVIARISETGDLLWAKNTTIANVMPENTLSDISAMPYGGFVLLQTTVFTPWPPTYISSFLTKMDEIGRTGNCIMTDASILVTPQTPTSELLLPDSLAAPGFQFWTYQTFPFPDSLHQTQICGAGCDSLLLHPENCHNNIDDDGDGLFDCLDPECACAVDSCALGYNNIWYWGHARGLDFNHALPKLLYDGKTYAQAATASICDVSGNLLFYTDGLNIYNRFHQLMTYGDLNPPTGFNFSDYKSLILPHPGDVKRYYVFNLEPNTGACKYSVVDLAMDGGKGSVIPGTKNFPLLLYNNDISVPTALKTCEGNYWLLVKRNQFNGWFFAFLIDQNGLSQDSVFSVIPGASGSDNLRFSPDGRTVAMHTGGGPIELYNFNPVTGKIAYKKRIAYQALSNYSNIAVEFSPNGRFIYATYARNMNGVPHSKIVQFDLAADDPEAILNSVTEIFSISGAAPPEDLYFKGLKVAPDGKIYVGSNSNSGAPTHYLHIIHRPNEPGAACQFQLNGLYVGPSSPFTNENLANTIQGLFQEPYIKLSTSIPDTVCYLHSPVQIPLAIESACADSISWTLSGAGGVIQPDSTGATVIFSQPGQATIIAVSYAPCGSASDTLHLTVLDLPVPALDLGPDREICDNGVVTLTATPGFDTYRWQNGFTGPELTTLLPGTYWVEAADRCGHVQTDTVQVTVAPETVLDLGSDDSQCPGIPRTFLRPDIFNRWRWTPDQYLSCDTCPAIQCAPESTSSWIVTAQTAAGCISVDTLIITVFDTLFLELDTVICAGTHLIIGGKAWPADTLAEIFLPASGPGCDTLLLANIAAKPAPVVSLPQDTSIRVGAEVLIAAALSGDFELLKWSPVSGLSCTDCTDPTAAPFSTTLFTLTATAANDCIGSDSILILVTDTCVLYIPTAFTPDGDGTNDWFYPATDPCVYEIKSWTIYDRWGNRIFERKNFEPNQSAQGWDGGKAPSDVYLWIVELEYFNGKREIRKGDVLLLR